MGHKTKTTSNRTDDDTMELPAAPDEPGEAIRGHRKTKAVLAAGAVASAVGATAAYRRRTAASHRAQNTSTSTPPPASGSAPPHDTSNQYSLSNPQTESSA